MTSADFLAGSPSDDMSKVQRLMHVDKLLLAAMPKIMPGIANEALIAELTAIQRQYQELLEAGLPTFPFYTEESLRTKIADTENFLARAHDSMNHVEEAASHYEKAAQEYEAVGAADQVQRSRASMARLQLAAGGNINDELQRLTSLIDRTEENTLPHAGALVELGELCCQSGDDFQGEKHLKAALAELDHCGGDPGGTNLADALSQTLQSIAQGTAKAGATTPIEQQVLLRDLYRRVYLALGQIYKETDPDTAVAYLARAKERDSQAVNDEFSQRMLDALAGDLGKLLNNG